MPDKGKNKGKRGIVVGRPNFQAEDWGKVKWVGKITSQGGSLAISDRDKKVLKRAHY